MKRRAGRMSVRDALIASKRAQDFYADMAGKPRIKLDIKPKRVVVRTEHADLEKHTLAAVADLLAVHPRVLFAVRQNSGSLPYESEGRAVPVWFYRILRRPAAEFTLTDFWGILKDNRLFAIECKRPSWKWSGDAREKAQAAFIAFICSLDGIGGFVCSGNEAKTLLE